MCVWERRWRGDGKLLVARGATGAVHCMHLSCRSDVCDPHTCLLISTTWLVRFCPPRSGVCSVHTSTSSFFRTQHFRACCTCFVQVFDSGSRAVLRQFQGHKRAVHVTRFAPDKLHVLSGGDDVTVRWWDVSTGQQLDRCVCVWLCVCVCVCVLGCVRWGAYS